MDKREGFLGKARRREKNIFPAIKYNQLADWLVETGRLFPLVRELKLESDTR